MTRSAWILVAAAAGLAGCTPTYRVHVNTYSELDGPLSRTAPIYIPADSNSPNPILRRQIASKIRDLLQGNGYNPVEKPDAGAYQLTFEVGIDSERVLDYAPVYRSFGGYYGRYHGGHPGWGLGYTTYMPYVDTVYTHWLRMRLYTPEGTGGKAESGEADPPPGRRTVWQGEAIVGTENPELREVVNYLLVGCLEYFAVDTEEWVTVKIDADDPRILGITAE